MARDEATARLRLDTKQAKGELRSFVKESFRTSKRIQKGIRQSVGRGLGVVGLGGGVGAGFAAVRGATESGLGDVIGESLGGIGHQISEFFLGSLNEKARASKSAREETIAAFGAIAGHSGKIPPGAKQFFDNVRSIREKEEKGRELFEGNKDFRGPGAGELIDRIMTGIGKLISDAVSELASKLNPFD